MSVSVGVCGDRKGRGASVSKADLETKFRPQVRRMWSYLAIVLVAFPVVCISMQGSESWVHPVNGSNKIQTEAFISAEPTTLLTQPAREGVVHSNVESQTDTESLAVVVRDDRHLEGSSVGMSGQSKMEREGAPASNDLDAFDVHATVSETEEKLPDQPPPSEDDLRSGNQDVGDSNEGEVSQAGSGEGDEAAGKSSTSGDGSEVGVEETSAEKDSGDKEGSPVEGVETSNLFVQSPDLPDLDDKELIQHALAMHRAQLGKKRTAPSKIAFLFLVRGPIPLAPLWERFFRGGERKRSVYIHASNTSGEHRDLPASFQGRHVRSQPVNWGGFDMVTAERRLYANALIDPDNRFFVLVSESCIPLFNFKVVYRYIKRSKYSFMANMEDPMAAITWKPSLAPEVPIEAWRKGDEWKELHRSMVATLLRDSKYFEKFYAHYGCPSCAWTKGKGFGDERYMPTLLNVRKPQLLANRTLTYVDWHSGTAEKFHPKTFSNDDVTVQALQEIRNLTSCHIHNVPTNPIVNCSLDGVVMPCYLFARKFDAESLPNLLKVAGVVMEY